MDAVKRPKVPAAVQPVFAEITAITSEFCAEHLDEEYARLCGELAGKLARKRPSPLLRGDRRIWAAGIVYAIGRVNFLADPAQRPHLRTDELAKLIGVKQTTMANKGRLIMDTLGIGLLDPEYSRSDMLDKNPLVWMLQVDTAASLLGMPVTVTELDYEDPARGLVARCDGPHGSGQVALADLAFPADSVAAWLHAAYRHHLGLKPFPATP